MSVTVSPKFQVVIPREVREVLQIKPGDQFEVFLFDGRIQLMKVRPIEDLLGFAEGIDTSLELREDRL